MRGTSIECEPAFPEVSLDKTSDAQHEATNSESSVSIRESVGHTALYLACIAADSVYFAYSRFVTSGRGE